MTAALGKAKARAEAYAKWIATPTPTHTIDRSIYLAIAELRRRSQSNSSPMSLDLAPYELKAFSQNGEDGVLDEILRRISTDTRTFVEFGVERGAEGVCVYLADVVGWSGHFLEADADCFSTLASKYCLSSRITTTKALVTAQNIELLLERLAVPELLDVLCIDIDSHDYWVWKAINRYHPRVVVIEYNAHLGTDKLVMPLDAAPQWDGGDYFGASITALMSLGLEKRYRLVHCDITGVNAFFVRADLVGANFLSPEDVVLRAPNYALQGLRWPARGGRWEDVG